MLRRHFFFTCWLLLALLCGRPTTLYGLYLFPQIEGDEPYDWRFYEHPGSDITNQYEESTPSHRIAIILDDVGHQHSSSFRSAHLPGSFTVAVLPFSPYARASAEWATATGKEVMLHIPMEPEIKQAWSGGLSLDMEEPELRDQLIQMLDSLPGIRGVNNHMGSALTQDPHAMAWVMDVLAQRNLYFIDSRTTAKTQALITAQQFNLPSAKRDVFLDNIRTEDAIAKQFLKLLAIAEKQGSAIGIGHPYPETLEYLSLIQPQLSARGIKLVPVSQLLDDRPSEQPRYSVVE